MSLHLFLARLLRRVAEVSAGAGPIHELGLIAPPSGSFILLQHKSSLFSSVVEVLVPSFFFPITDGQQKYRPQQISNNLCALIPHTRDLKPPEFVLWYFTHHRHSLLSKQAS